MVPEHVWSLVKPYGLRPEAEDLPAADGALPSRPGRSSEDVDPWT